MKQLNWYNESAPDDSMYIGSVPITPATWNRGIVCDEDGDYWWQRRYGLDNDSAASTIHALCVRNPSDILEALVILRTRPVYPPVGFGGMSEDRLWDLMWGWYGARHIGIGERTFRKGIILSEDWKYGGHFIGIDRNGNIALTACSAEEDYGCVSPLICAPKETERIITALRNAQVLSLRIMEGMHGLPLLTSR